MKSHIGTSNATLIVISSADSSLPFGLLEILTGDAIEEGLEELGY